MENRPLRPFPEYSMFEFFTETEDLNMDRFESIGIIKLDYKFNDKDLQYFKMEIDRMLNQGEWTKNELLNLFKRLLPNFNHIEKNKHLDNHL